MAPGDIRGVDVAMLRTFDALMRERSVSRAAARLFLSQPAVSASLGKLRRVFGDPLFTRTAHGVLPTERAQALAVHVERVLAEMAAMLDSGEGFDPTSSQRIFRIAGTDHTSRLMLPALVSELVACGSGIRIFWESGAIAALNERLRKGDVDLAVLPRTQTPRDVEAALLYSDRYVLAARHGHAALAQGVDVTLDAFCDTPHVFLGYGSTMLDDRIDAALQREGRRRNAQVAVTTFSQMVDVLVRTDHLAVMPERVVQTHADKLQQLALPIPLPDYQLFVCWDSRSNGDAGLQWLKAMVLRTLATAA
ncbi:MAG: LysR family transcriptional regulator [Rubrivivax sp.]